MENKLKKLLSNAETEIKNAKDENELLSIEKDYLGKKGSINEILKSLKDLSNEEKKVIGPLANKIRNELQEKISQKFQEIKNSKFKEQIKNTFLDISLNTYKSSSGSIHPLRILQEKIESIFKQMGFSILDGPEVESEYYNFDALNFKADHPARDMHDTYFIKSKEEQLILRTHTSPMQVRNLKEYGAPLKAILPGRCFRYEDQDATHEHTLFQIEGLYIDENISIANLFAIFKEFLSQLFEKEINIQIRPAYFPFTEPSVEFDFSCPFCKSGCKVCKHTQFIELSGGGMVHANVLKSAGIDPNKYQGFAFGFGLDRLAMLYYGINNIKYFRENDLRFLKQF